MSEAIELAIIGAGPAGMAAAVEASRLGVEAVVFDEQTAPGGQIYRNIERLVRERPGDLALLGRDYAAGSSLVDAFRGSTAEFRGGTAVWEITAEGAIGLLDASGARTVRARRVLIATGALERPVPVAGWTLPGVLSAGAAQTLLKASGLVPDGPIVLAGGGPLIYLVAWQLARAGADLQSVLLTAPVGQRPAALRHLPAALRDVANLWKGRRWELETAALGVRFVDRVTHLMAEGDECVQRVRYSDHKGDHTIDCAMLLLHDGVIPNTQLSRVAGCPHVWDDLQRCWRPQTDPNGATPIERIAVAGDGAGIGGADAAATRGRLAAIDAARRLDRLDAEDADGLSSALDRTLSRQLAIRPFLDTWFRPADWLMRPRDDVIVCRCEEVTAGELRRVAALGCQGPNQAKSFTRAGMGPCQGRLCGPVVSEIFAKAHRQTVQATGYYRIRPPVRPITVGEAAGLAGLPGSPDAPEAQPGQAGLEPAR